MANQNSVAHQRQEHRLLGELVLGQFPAPAPRPPVGSNRGPHFLLLYGACVIRQEGRRIRLSSDDFALVDTSYPYSIGHESAPLRALLLPQRSLRLPAADLATLTATRLPGGYGAAALLATLLTQLAATAHTFTTVQLLRTADTVVDLVTTVLAGQLSRDPAETIAAQGSLLLRAKAYLEEHLDDPELTPAVVAAAAHVSTGYLHKLFRAEGTTVCGWMRKRRLECCRRDLADPSTFALPVNAVAARWGFVDAAHFSRLFKLTYGMPPREYRILSGLDSWRGPDYPAVRAG
ncbi:AraC family transcriptional regulator [Nocardia panacis]|nr:AraC family transcriptional regulator [Nocardia panacis]